VKLMVRRGDKGSMVGKENVSFEKKLRPSPEL
jgi:hypothetical protein